MDGNPGTSGNQSDYNPNLDLLLAAIDEMESQSETSGSRESQENNRELNNNSSNVNNEDQADQENANNFGGDNIDPADGNVVENNNVSPVQRPALIRQYISSSSAKRRMLKSNHCFYCQVDCTKQEMKNHLESEEMCKTLYCRKYRVKEIDSVLVTIYNCLFCDEEVRQLATHLKKAPPCLLKFLQLFQIDRTGVVSNDVKAVMTKVVNCKRSGFKSRQSLKRKFENSLASANKKKKLEEQPMEYSLNSFVRETTNLNYTMCAKCKSSITSSFMEIDEDTECIRSNQFDLPTLQENQRLGKTYLCQYCLSNEESNQAVKKSIFKFIPNIQADKVILVPAIKDEHDDMDTKEVFLKEDGKLVKVMLPTSISSLGSFELNVKPQTLSSFEIQKVLNGEEKITNETLALAYENQLSKYKRLKDTTDMFSGRISDEANKMLSNVKLSPNESRLCESDAWHHARARNVEFKMIQRGTYCLYVEINIPMNLHVIAQKLIQDGKVISLDFEGQVSQEHNFKYFVHTNHNSSSFCVEGNCTKVDLEQYIRNEDIDVSLDIKTLTAYLEYSDSFASAFVRNIIVTPSSNISSSHYHFQFRHCSNNLVKLVGIIWPESMQSINLIDYDPMSDEEKMAIYSNYLNVADNSVTTSSDATYLMSKFNLSNHDAAYVVKLVKEHQIKVCICAECPQCTNIKLPSLVLMWSMPADSPENIYPCRQLLRSMKNHLFSLTENTIMNISTQEWLNLICGELECSVMNNDQYDVVLFGENLRLTLSEGFLEMMRRFDGNAFFAAYHYALQIGNQNMEKKIIMKRNKLVECFTDPYNLWFIKAAKAAVKVDFLSSTRDFTSIIASNHLEENVELDPIPNHSESSLLTAFSLLNVRKLNAKSSSVSEFLNTSFDARMIFKKVRVRSDKTYTVVNKPNELFELQQNFISRYNGRLNGGDLTLAEFTVWYETSPKSELQYDLYSNKLDKITPSAIKQIQGEGFLPELILCRNKDVMAKRNKKPKTLETIKFDESHFDYKFSKVILFRNHQDISTLSKEQVDLSFDETDENGSNIIFQNERYMNISLIMNQNINCNNFQEIHVVNEEL